MEDTRAVQAAINNEILTALLQWMPESVAKNVVRAMAKGLIPFVKVAYPGGAK